MTLTDDGTRITIRTEPWWIGKLFAVVFGVLALTFPVIVVASLLVPPRTATIACDAKICSLDDGRRHDTYPVASIERVKVQRIRGAKNRSAGTQLVLFSKGNTAPVPLSETLFRNDEPLRVAAAGFEAFLADPNRTQFRASYRSTDTDWAVLVPFTFLSPLLAWAFIAMWVSREVTVDRPARTIRVQRRGALRRPTDTTLGFDEVERVRVHGVRWVMLSVVTRDATLDLLQLPRSSTSIAQVEQLAAKLDALLPGKREAA